MGRLVMFALLGACAWYLWSTGVFETYVVNNGRPKEGIVCKVHGPVGEGVYLCQTLDLAKFEIDSHIGTASDKMAGAYGRSGYLRSGEIMQLPEGTKVEVIGTRRVMVQAAPYWVVGVKVKSGDYAGHEGFIRREDLMDTPVQELIQKVRKVERPE